MKINGDDTYIPYLNDQLGHFARASELIVFSGIGINAIVVIVEQIRLSHRERADAAVSYCTSG